METRRRYGKVAKFTANANTTIFSQFNVLPGPHFCHWRAQWQKARQVRFSKMSKSNTKIGYFGGSFLWDIFYTNITFFYLHFLHQNVCFLYQFFTIFCFIFQYLLQQKFVFFIPILHHFLPIVFFFIYTKVQVFHFIRHTILLPCKTSSYYLSYIKGIF